MALVCKEWRVVEEASHQPRLLELTPPDFDPLKILWLLRDTRGLGEVAMSIRGVKTPEDQSERGYWKAMHLLLDRLADNAPALRRLEVVLQHHCRQLSPPSPPPPVGTEYTYPRPYPKNPKRREEITGREYRRTLSGDTYRLLGARLYFS